MDTISTLLTRALATSMSSPLTGRGSTSSFSPASLFAGGEDGAYFDLSISALYQDSGATTPVTAAGDPVGYVEDLSGNGNHFTQATDADRPIYRVDANGKPYLEIGLGADSLDFGGLGSGLPSTFSFITAMEKQTDPLGTMFGAKSGADYIGIWQASTGSNANISGFSATVDLMKLNSVDVSADKRQGFLDRLNASAKIVFIAGLSSAVSSETGWCMGDANQSVLQSDMNVYSALWIDRALTSEEQTSAQNYFGQTFDSNFSLTPNDIDLIMAMGQSNAEGRGDDGHIPIATTTRGIEIDSNGDIVADPLADPVGGAVGSSMWPAFANSHYAESGNYAAVVDAAVGSSALIPLGSALWGTSGSARTNAVSYANDAIETLNNNVNFSLQNVYGIWVQGETEVLTDNGTTITATAYEPALEGLADYMEANADQWDGMWACLLSPRWDDSTQLEQQNVDTVLRTNEYNTAIMNACDDNANITMGHEGGASLASIGDYRDDVHWDTRGLQEVGTCLPKRIAGTNSAPTVTSPYIGFTDYIDSVDGDKTSRTESHSTTAATTCLVVCVAGGAYNTTANELDFDVTFGGVDMARGGVTLAEGTGQASSGIFYINEDIYGSSLNSVTANIVVTPRLQNGSAKTVNYLHFTAINAQSIYRLERFEGTDITTNTTTSTSITPLLGNLLISCSAANLNSGTASTGTISNLTEITDGNIERTKTGQILVGQTATAADTTTSSDAVFADSMQEIATTIVAMRGKIDGET